jgi:hypothetical protein
MRLRLFKCLCIHADFFQLLLDDLPHFRPLKFAHLVAKQLFLRILRDKLIKNSLELLTFLARVRTLVLKLFNKDV